MNERNIYTVFEVCELLKISRKTINNYIKSGELRAVRIGNQIRITEDSLTQFLKIKEIKILKSPIDILKNQN